MRRAADHAALFGHYWKVLTGRALPEPEYQFARAALGRKWRYDWAFVAERVAVEVDGGQFAPGGGRHATDRDREKLNHAAALGWRVLRFSPGQLQRDPDACIALVLRALGE